MITARTAFFQSPSDVAAGVAPELAWVSAAALLVDLPRNPVPDFGLTPTSRAKGLRQPMTARREEEKLREVADHHVADDAAVAAQLYADADYLAQLRKAPKNVNQDETTDDA